MFSMKKWYAVFCFTWFLVISLHATDFPRKLSEQAKISVVSIDYSDISHSLFSKSCLRIYDKETGFDKIIDFASFENFDDDFFGLKFFLKNKKAAITIEDFFVYFLRESHKKRTSLTESNLQLNPNEVNYIYSFIKTVHTALPDYHYDFDIINNNSETHISQILHDCYRMAGGEEESAQYYFSNIVRHNLGYKKINDSFVLTSQKEDLTFLNQNSSQRFHEEHTMLTAILCILSGIVFLLTAYQVVSCFFEWIYSMSVYKSVQIFDFMILFMAGFSGIVIIFQDFFSNQSILRNNFQFLFLCPLHLVAAFLVFKEFIPNKIQIVYWSATSAFSVMYVIGVVIAEKQFPVITALVVLPVLLRTLYFDFKAILKKSGEMSLAARQTETSKSPHSDIQKN